MFFNINGFSNFVSFLHEHTEDLPVMMCICESWLSCEPAFPPDLLSDYRMIFSPAVREKQRGRASGGLVLYVKKSLSVRPSSVIPWWICCFLRYTDVSLILFCVYFKPSLDLDHLLSEFEVTLAEVRKAYFCAPCFILGDFNS